MRVRTIIRRITDMALKVILWPMHMQYRHTNGTVSTGPRKEIPNDILLGAVRDAIREGNSVTILVKGWSMRPFLEHLRDKVILDAPEELRIGDAVLAEITPGHFVLHRIIEMDGDEITLMGDGNLVGTEHCRKNDVCGVVKQYIRPTRTINADDPKLIRNIQRWRRLLPYRKYLLMIYRAIV